MLFIVFNLFLQQESIILDKKLTPYIYILFSLFVINNIFSQEKKVETLEIFSRDSTENTVIKSLNYKKNHNSFSNLNKTKNNVVNTLKDLGFYSIIIINETRNNNKSFIELSLGDKITKIQLQVNPKDKSFFKSLKFELKNQILTIKGNELKKTLSFLSESLSKKGEVFSKIRLDDISISNSILNASLIITNSKKRIIKNTTRFNENPFKTSYKKTFRLYERNDA